MVILLHISREGMSIAEVIYRSGFHVEVRVREEFRDDKIHFELTHSDNELLEGTWEDALDRYFNEGIFDSRDLVFPGELPRMGSAREHKSLFRAAAQALRKDLKPAGYTVDVEYP